MESQSQSQDRDHRGKNEDKSCLLQVHPDELLIEEDVYSNDSGDSESMSEDCRQISDAEFQKSVEKPVRVDLESSIHTESACFDSLGLSKSLSSNKNYILPDCSQYRQYLKGNKLLSHFYRFIKDKDKELANMIGPNLAMYTSPPCLCENDPSRECKFIRIKTSPNCLNLSQVPFQELCMEDQEIDDCEFLEDPNYLQK